MSSEHVLQFCTCTNLKCPVHPVNHDKGCDLCMQKNIKIKEVPRCLTMQVTDKVEVIENGTFENFADEVMRKKNTEK